MFLTYKLNSYVIIRIMDGHDDDKNVNGAGGSPTQGIFSTPELSVDAEKIAQDNTAAAAESSRAKIASIFANTETGKQAQRLNDAMIANTVPATEDIVLDNGPKKRRKWPIVLAVVVLLAVVGGAVGYFVVGGVPEEKKRETLASLFGDYRKYLVDGPESIDENEDAEDTANTGSEWFLFNLENSDLTTSEQDGYITELKKRYRVFADTAKEKNVIPREQLSMYTGTLNALVSILQINVLSQKVLDSFLEGGAGTAYRYVEEISNDIYDDSASNSLTVVANALKDFLSAQLTLIEIYSNNQCIENGLIDYTCNFIGDGANSAVSEAQQQQDSASLVMQYNLSNLENSLKTNTRVIGDVLEAQNE